MITSGRKIKTQSELLTLVRVKGPGSKNDKPVRSLSEKEKAAGRRYLATEVLAEPVSRLQKRMQSSRG